MLVDDEPDHLKGDSVGTDVKPPKSNDLVNLLR
jgi:hypothetical protein